MKVTKLLMTTILVGGLLTGCASHKTSVYFKNGSANLSGDYRKLVKETAQIAQNGQYRKIKISGYTDTVGTTMTNKELASKRVNAVDKMLVKSGIDESKVTRAAYGEKWFHHNKDEQSDESMRRVDIRVYK